MSVLRDLVEPEDIRLRENKGWRAHPPTYARPSSEALASLALAEISAGKAEEEGRPEPELACRAFLQSSKLSFKTKMAVRKVSFRDMPRWPTGADL